MIIRQGCCAACFPWAVLGPAASGPGPQARASPSTLGRVSTLSVIPESGGIWRPRGLRVRRAHQRAGGVPGRPVADLQHGGAAGAGARLLHRGDVLLPDLHDRLVHPGPGRSRPRSPTGRPPSPPRRSPSPWTGSAATRTTAPRARGRSRWPGVRQRRPVRDGRVHRRLRDGTVGVADVQLPRTDRRLPIRTAFAYEAGAPNSDTDASGGPYADFAHSQRERGQRHPRHLNRRCPHHQARRARP